MNQTASYLIAQFSARPMRLGAFLTDCTIIDASAVSDSMHLVIERQAGSEQSDNFNMASCMTAISGNSDGISKFVKANKTAGGPKRPLNSFMAFRKYYGASLPGYTQKAISKIMVVLWREDPLKAKWAMLAKAYSIVRGDKDKEDAPLSDFLATCAPAVGVIPADQYMIVMGWQISNDNGADETQMPVLLRPFVPALEAFPDSVTTTTWSVEDIVSYATSMGIADDDANYRQQHDSVMESFSMVVQPSSLSQSSVYSTESAHGMQALVHSPIITTDNVQIDPNLAMLAELVDGTGQLPYAGYFDPLAEDISLAYNPTIPKKDATDHGRFQAYCLERKVSYPIESCEMDLDISDYVHDGVEEVDV